MARRCGRFAVRALLVAVILALCLGPEASAAPVNGLEKRREKTLGDLLEEVMDSVAVSFDDGTEGDTDGDTPDSNEDEDDSANDDDASPDDDSTDESDDSDYVPTDAVEPTTTTTTSRTHHRTHTRTPFAQITQAPDGTITGNLSFGEAGNARITVVVATIPPKASRSLYITAVVLFILVMISIPLLFVCSRLCEPITKKRKSARFEDDLPPKSSKNGLGTTFKSMFTESRPSTDVRDPYSFRPLAGDAGDLGRVGLIHAEDEEVDLDSMDTLRQSTDITGMGSSTRMTQLNSSSSKPPEYLPTVNVFAGFSDDAEKPGGDGTLYRVSLDSVGDEKPQ